MAQPPPLPPGTILPPDAAPVIQYATPQQFARPAAAWREGDLLVVPIDGVLPMRCVKCNGPIDPKFTWMKTIYWFHPLYYLILLPGITIIFLIPALIIYGIVTVIVRKGTRVEAGLCANHGGKRSRRIVVGSLIGLLGMALVVAALFFGAAPKYYNSHLSPTFVVTGLALIVVALFWGMFVGRVLWPKRIEKDYGYLRGACPEFLDSLGGIHDTGLAAVEGQS